MMSGKTGFGGLFWIVSACGNGRMGDSGVLAGDSWPCVFEEDEERGDALAMRVMDVLVLVLFEASC
jgi:hypothetical protein